MKKKSKPQISHGCTSLEQYENFSKWYKYINYCSMLTDLGVYYGPFHAAHHKYLGISGRLTLVKELFRRKITLNQRPTDTGEGAV
jgi:hypothetical protein